MAILADTNKSLDISAGMWRNFFQFLVVFAVAIAAFVGPVTEPEIHGRRRAHSCTVLDIP